ncbi:MAG: hypothetical protein MUE37_08310 [Bacteroidales bacterium]|jgi:hypothetical protein|nr:hypothetical protein [Bacteroidales bacterium]
MTNKAIIASLALLLILPQNHTNAQQIQIDRGIRAAGLWCFPLLNDSLSYLYLPNQAFLSRDGEGRPQFSLMRYVDNRAPVSGNATTITEAAGGAILHFLVEYNTHRDTVEAAQRYLRELFGTEEIKVKGPVIFEKGSYSLISSVLTPAGQRTSSMLALGSAPVLEGSKIALSFELTPQKSKILLESFQMSTPDISLSFDFSFTGLTDAYQAELLIDWSEVHQSQAFQAGGSVYFISADVQASFDKLRRDNAIRLVTSGEDTNMDALLNTVYDKLLNLMFSPVKPENVPEDKRGGLMDALSSLTGSKGLMGSRKTTGFGIHAGFQLKDMRSEGTSRLNFNSRSVVSRHHYIVFNIGDIYQRYGNDQNHFRTINIFDPDFSQREVHVSVDGSLEPEFTSFINSVTVTLRKKHEGGEETISELFVDKNTLADAPGPLVMVYGSLKDTDRLKWLDYDYKSIWQFKRGGSYTTDWNTQSASMINLFAPYERRVIEVIGDNEVLLENNIRSVIVELSYRFFGEIRKSRLIIMANEPVSDKFFEITQPVNDYTYEYTVKWIKQDGQQISKNYSDSSGIIFIDNL